MLCFSSPLKYCLDINEIIVVIIPELKLLFQEFRRRIFSVGNIVWKLMKFQTFYYSWTPIVFSGLVMAYFLPLGNKAWKLMKISDFLLFLDPIVVSGLLEAFAAYLMAVCGIRASKLLFNKLLLAILQASMSFPRDCSTRASAEQILGRSL